MTKNSPLLTRTQFSLLVIALLQISFFLWFIWLLYRNEFILFTLPIFAVAEFGVLIFGFYLSSILYPRFRVMLGKRLVTRPASFGISLLVWLILIGSFWFPVREIQLPIVTGLFPKQITFLGVMLNSPTMVESTNSRENIVKGLAKIAVKRNDISICMRLKDTWDVYAECFNEFRPGINEKINTCVEDLANSSDPNARGYKCFLNRSILDVWPLPPDMSFPICQPLIPKNIFQLLFDKCVLPLSK